MFSPANSVAAIGRQSQASASGSTYTMAACLREIASGRLVLGGVPMRRAAAALHTVQRLHASLLAVSAETELTYTGDTIKL